MDRVLGTLTSNLPDKETRQGCHAAAAAALTSDGRFVFSAHHCGIRERIARAPKKGRYAENGIYRRLLEPREIKAELAPFFRRVRIRGINVVPPFAHRLGLSLRAIDRVCRRLPGFRWFAGLLLVTASLPRR